MIWILPLARTFAWLQIDGREHLRDLDGPVIFASNHQSFMDGPVIMAGRRYYRLSDGADRAALASLPAFRGPRREILFDYVERLIGMRSAGDLVLYGNRGADEPAVAFAWEFGSHGGIGAGEIESFMIHPADAAFDFGAVTLPEELFGWFTRYRRSDQPAEEEALHDSSGPLEAAP